LKYMEKLKEIYDKHPTPSFYHWQLLWLLCHLPLSIHFSPSVCLPCFLMPFKVRQPLYALLLNTSHAYHHWTSVFVCSFFSWDETYKQWNAQVLGAFCEYWWIQTLMNPGPARHRTLVCSGSFSRPFLSTPPYLLLYFWILAACRLWGLEDIVYSNESHGRERR
jgi:hypothetical protein